MDKSGYLRISVEVRGGCYSKAVCFGFVISRSAVRVRVGAPYNFEIRK